MFHAPDGLLLHEEEVWGLSRSRPSFVAMFRMALFAGILGVNVDLQMRGQPLTPAQRQSLIRVLLDPAYQPALAGST